MALDLTGGRRVKVNGLEPSETPMISPPNKSRWNGGDNLSTSKLGMMLSTIQSRLVDLDNSDKTESDQQTQRDSPSTTVEGNEPTPTYKNDPNALNVNSKISASLPAADNGASKSSVGESKAAIASRPTMQKSVSISTSTPVKKPNTTKVLTPSSSTTTVRIVGRPIVTGASVSAQSSKAPTTPKVTKSAQSSSALKPPTTPMTLSKTNPRDAINRTPSGAMSSTKPVIEKAHPQSMGRKCLSTSTPFASSSTSIRKKLHESGEGDKSKIEPISSVSKMKIPSRSSTPTKPTVTQRTAVTPTFSSKTSTNFTPSPKASSTVKNLHNTSFSDMSTSSRRTPVKSSTPKFSQWDHAKDLARKSSFGSVGSNSMSSVGSSASKSRRSMGASRQPALNMKSQKSVDELDEIYSTDHVVSTLKAQKIPSAQLLRTTIQRIDTVSVPHTMNPLRRGSASPYLNSNNSSFSNLSRRGSKTGKEDLLDAKKQLFESAEASRKTEISNNFGMDIKTVEADEDADAFDGDDDHLQSPPTSRSSSLQDLKPLGKAPSTNSLLGVKPSPLVSSRSGPFSHRKSYMMPQTPNSPLETDQTSEIDDGVDDLLSMFVHSTEIYEQYPSPPAPALSTKTKSTSFNKFQSSPRKQVFPPPYPLKSLFPTDVGLRENTPYMPPLQHSTPSAISAIYRAAVAKEAANSQTMLGRIASFKR